MAVTISDRAVLQQSQTHLERASTHAQRAEIAHALVLASLGHKARNRPVIEAIQSDTLAVIRRCDVLAGRIGTLLAQEPR